jgi:hypothetical protein
MRLFRYVLSGAGLLMLAACKDALVVTNQNAADRDRALATFADLESFIGSGYATAHNATLAGSNDDLNTQLLVMGLENVSGLANFAMGPRSAVPRGSIDNQPNGTGDAGNLRDFVVGHRAARIASLALAKLSVLSSGTPAQDLRDRAFCFFVRGVAQGNLALAYDSASILSASDGPQEIVPLSGYATVMQAALADLDSAIAEITVSGVALPANWINGNALSSANFVRLIRSYKARFRAAVARTPAERAAANWTLIAADAQNGITADFTINMDPSSGWDVIWPAQAFATGSASWTQMSQFILGMADSSGGYDTWLGTPLASRQPFLVVTADRRLPQGATRAAQNADARAGFGAFYVTGTTNPGRPYIRNRPAGEDAPAPAFGQSFYDFWRTRGFFSASPTRTGPYPIMSLAEMRLLRAEAALRANDYTTAMALINVTRADTGRGGLDSLKLIADTLTPVAGGNHCVPRVPDAAQGFTKTKCGNIWDALKWEYRIETAYLGYGQWYFASRGWGDLPEGTPVNWPVPNEEMLVRSQPFYSLGGVGFTGGAAKGNYGLFSGGVY